MWVPRVGTCRALQGYYARTRRNPTADRSADGAPAERPPLLVPLGRLNDVKFLVNRIHDGDYRQSLLPSITTTITHHERSFLGSHLAKHLKQLGVDLLADLHQSPVADR
eukprot:7102311-Prymnesium_polylepis.1